MTKLMWSQEMDCCCPQEKKNLNQQCFYESHCNKHTYGRTCGDKGRFQMLLVTIGTKTRSILSPLYLTYFHLNELTISCSCCPIIYLSLSHSHISRTDCQVMAFSQAQETLALPMPYL